jgi:hypothetical protein
MIRTFLAGIAVLTLLSSAARAEERVGLVRDVPGPGVKAPKGQAPRFFTVTGLDKDQVELTEVGPTAGKINEFKKYKPAFKYLEISDASGKTLSAEDFTDRVKIGTVVIVPADAKKVDPAYLSVMKGDTVVLGGVVAATEATPAVTKDEIKYEMDDLEKNFGIKFKAAKLEQTKTGGDTQVTITLEFTKDVPVVTGIGEGPTGLQSLRKLCAGKPTMLGMQLQCYFFDEDGVVFTKQPPGKIDGAVSGKEGDAFRINQIVPGDVLAKTKKISFREEPFKK